MTTDTCGVSWGSGVRGGLELMSGEVMAGDARDGAGIGRSASGACMGAKR
jgi:hypothetical protein